MRDDSIESAIRKPAEAGVDPAPLSLSLLGVTAAVGSVEICSEVSLEVDAGQIVGIIGPNGSGKTTLLRTVYRVLRPRLGRVVVGEEDLWELRPSEAARRIAVVVQEPRSDFEFTVREVVTMGRSPHQSSFARESAKDRERVDEALAHVSIADLAARSFSTLSGGEKQRALIARALVQEARVLILDEPTNHLDIRYQLEVLDLVRSVGVTTLMSIHDVNLAAEYCDHIVVLQGGRVQAAGPVEAVMLPEVLEPVFGVRVERIARENGRALYWFQSRAVRFSAAPRRHSGLL
ncbi:MAG: ABC transporter ATP-binding protein [Chloroflexota bacterium]|nr:ABC transporter ATP-binding protein [Chloroflexota bacterium]MDE2968707.1 ABC transporter ATP-binding protein [Chloroflexota bacterium]